MRDRCCFLVFVVASVAPMVATLGCNRGDGTARMETAVSESPSIPVDTARGAVRPTGWDASAGPVLLVVGERPDAAIIVFPDVQGEHAAAELEFDTTALRGAIATLVSRSGATSAATLGERTTPGEDEDCVGWPMARVRARSAAGDVPAPWNVGLIGSRLTAVPLDSVASLSPADSATLVAEVTRLASTIPVRIEAAPLRGLPFSVQDARRFEIPSGIAVVVARVVRRVHQEANPLEERTLVIAERDSSLQHEPPDGYRLAFHERAVGPEETLEGTEILAALAPRASQRPLLVVARESENGVRYAFLERLGPNNWKVKWTSALVRC